jgi:release factor glutamine methyltransferase
MTLGQLLAAQEAKLKAAGISSARLDVLILLEDILHKDRAYLLAHPEHLINEGQARRLDRKTERRAHHVPLAYIRGHSEFYGRSFRVSRHVLEPRPESETMIEMLKKLRLPPRPAIADVGTGNGAIGITAALEIPGSIVDLYDISAGCVSVAKHNTHLHELHLHVRKMNLLSRPLRPYDVVLANMPYVPDHWHINEAALHEPKIAIFGGPDGLDVYRKLFAQLQRFTWKPRYVLTEALPPQHDNLADVAAQNGFALIKTDDFIQGFTTRRS